MQITNHTWALTRCQEKLFPLDANKSQTQLVISENKPFTFQETTYYLNKSLFPIS